MDRHFPPRQPHRPERMPVPWALRPAQWMLRHRGLVVFLGWLWTMALSVIAAPHVIGWLPLSDLGNALVWLVLVLIGTVFTTFGAVQWWGNWVARGRPDWLDE